MPIATTTTAAIIRNVFMLDIFLSFLMTHYPRGGRSLQSERFPKK
jgi:hypothetical protein